MRTSLPQPETVTEAEKLALIDRISREIAKRRRIKDPSELWGAGWEGVAVAERREQHRRGTLRGFLVVNIKGAMLDSLKPLKRLRAMEPGFMSCSRFNPADYERPYSRAERKKRMNGTRTL